MPVDEGGPRKAVIGKRKEIARGTYPALWRRVFDEWQADGVGNHAWLTYAANYLLKTGGLRWALDPFSMSSRLHGITEPDFAHDLKSLELVVLSHRHNDHLDLRLVKIIAALPIQWIIPQHMLGIVRAEAHIPMERVIIPQNGQSIFFKGLTLTPFDGLHFHGVHGVPETGYLAEFEDKRWLFPGDTRDLTFSKMPSFGHLDGVFAHLWLGKGCADLDAPPKLDEFCRFIAAFDTRRIVLTHLNEYGREERELWDEGHVEMVKTCMRKIKSPIPVEKAEMGDRVDL